MWDARHSRVLGEPVRPNTGDRADVGIWDALAGFTFATPGLVLLPDGSIMLTYFATINDITGVRAFRFRPNEGGGARGSETLYAVRR